MEKDNNLDLYMPKVSIIVPVYNVEKYLRPCLDSIEAQTFTDFEAVLVDDGSTDNSGKICDEYAAKDPRFIVVHKRNEGVAKARITAFEHSKGDLITFIDSDDFVTSDFLEIMVNTFQKNSVDMISCQYYTYQNGKSFTTKRSVSGYLNKEMIIKMLKTNYLYDLQTGCAGIPVELCTKLTHRRYLKDALYIGEGLKWAEDQTVTFSILQSINSLYVLDDYLYYYVKHQGQATKIYTPELLPHLLEAYHRYQLLDTKGLLGNQLIIRTWLLSIKHSIFHTMPSTISNYTSFIKEMNRLCRLQLWKQFFDNKSTFAGWKNDLQFWILKLGMYRLFYFLYYQRTLKKIN